MYEDEIARKIENANKKWKKGKRTSEFENSQRISFMKRLLSALEALNPGSIYEIGNGEEWLRVVNLDGSKIKIMHSSGSSSKEEKDYSIDALARSMSEEAPGFPLVLQEILQSAFDDITIKRLS